jgi:pimeloyl-ACP methyl ester carboxylesterase
MIVFLHGFLDDRHAWDDVVALLDGTETLPLDLPGSGERADDTGPFGYEYLAADVTIAVDALDAPVVLVGHGTGAAVAELVAAARPQRVVALVLVSPVPLQGMHLPGSALEPFRALGGSREAQRAARRRLSLGDVGKLLDAGMAIRPAVVRELAQTWNDGTEAPPAPYPGPVLILRGAGDPYVTEAVVGATRFASARIEAISGAGHWPHVERPHDVAAKLRDFMPRERAWQDAFAHRSEEGFDDVLADHVVLEASALRSPIEGREQVKHVMGVASSLYDSLAFTHEATSGRRTYLEWEASALGLEMSGITILTRDGHGRIVNARIHHRPLGAAMRFSAELRTRMHGGVDPGHFYSP